MLLKPIDKSAKIIEFGPSYNPIAPKSSGWNANVLDHASREDLVEKYRTHSVDTDRIEEVDFVWSGGPIIDAVPAHLHGTFDALIASHVIEHTTDVLGFLNAAEALLGPAGVVILAVLDKRYCFDYFRPASTTGQVLEAAAERHDRHTCRVLFDHTAYSVTADGAIKWGQAPVHKFDFIAPLTAAKHLFAARPSSAGAYVDARAWQFTPGSFELILFELSVLGETDWKVDEITTATGCEFYVWLRRGAKAAVASLPVEQVDARRVALLRRSLIDLKDQIDFALSRSAQPASDPAGAEPNPLAPEPARAPPGGPQGKGAASGSDVFERRAPSNQTAVDVFAGRWASDLGPVLDVVGTGGSPLFVNDGRPQALADAFGQGGKLDGMDVLELGPLEGGHTYALEKLGAASVTAVESNVESWLKCLIVKEVLDLSRSRFLLGDVVEYLSTCTRKFDAVMASGILYHMADPLGLIQEIAAVTDRVFMWTHYYRPGSNVKVFRSEEIERFDQQFNYWSHDYGDGAHLGGNASLASWMEREDILRAFRCLGLGRITVLAEDHDHPHGPSFSFVAAR